MAEVENRAAAPASPPPNCAICLGSCTDKCFSDSCMHQFCFTCLLEWSKVKPVCPLCKQPFNSIIHNVKSNNEYDQHVVERPEINPQNGNIMQDDFIDLLLPSAPPSRHFQFRTTFTVDPGGELAIQQMLLTHPLTHSVYIPGPMPHRYNALNRHHRRRDVSSTAFRRLIYHNGLWAVTPPQHEVYSRYRETGPGFFSMNPTARNRLVPWLNRELNALLEENTQQVMQLVDVILAHLLQHDINGPFFRSLLREYLNQKTDHFIHEFYSFMRSPFDMIGYDRNVHYAPRPATPIELLSDQDSDSDVAIVSVTATNTFASPTLEVIEINSSDGESVILVDSETQDSAQQPEVPAPAMPASSASSGEERRKPILPLKIRLKHKRQTRDRRGRKRRYQRSSSSSTSSTSSSTTSTSSSTSSSEEEEVRPKHVKRPKKYKRTPIAHCKVPQQSSSSSRDETDSPLHKPRSKQPIYDSDDHLPLAKLKSRVKKRKLNRKRHVSETITSTSPTSSSPNTQYNPAACNLKVENDAYIPTTSYYGNPAENLPPNHDEYYYKNNYPTPGPSSSGRLKSVIVKREDVKDFWFARPCKEETSDDE